jgi:CheY-like chemotaxis protein
MKVPVTALIIDDDTDDQEIFLMCVTAVNKEIVCRTANNGPDAIAMLESRREYVPDFIFLDVNMPKMNGIECLKVLKQIDHLRQTKIYMYSTTSEKAVLTESKKLGAEDFIIKPASPTVLKETLSDIFPKT